MNNDLGMYRPALPVGKEYKGKKEEPPSSTETNIFSALNNRTKSKVKKQTQKFTNKKQ